MRYRTSQDKAMAVVVVPRAISPIRTIPLNSTASRIAALPSHFATSANRQTAIRSRVSTLATVDDGVGDAGQQARQGAGSCSAPASHRSRASAASSMRSDQVASIYSDRSIVQMAAQCRRGGSRPARLIEPRRAAAAFGQVSPLSAGARWYDPGPCPLRHLRRLGSGRSRSRLESSIRSNAGGSRASEADQLAPLGPAAGPSPATGRLPSVRK